MGIFSCNPQGKLFEIKNRVLLYIITISFMYYQYTKYLNGLETDTHSKKIGIKFKNNNYILSTSNVK